MVLKKNPADLDGHLLRGRVHLARRETTPPSRNSRRCSKAEPRLAPARYQLALAHLQAGSVQQAKAELKEATTIAPNFVEAVLLLAELNIQTGAVHPAIEDLERAHRPPAADARGATCSWARPISPSASPPRPPRSAAVSSRRRRRTPRGPYLVGIGLLAQGKRAEARKEFEAALALAPGFSTR